MIVGFFDVLGPFGDRVSDAEVRANDVPPPPHVPPIGDHDSCLMLIVVLVDKIKGLVNPNGKVFTCL